MIKFSSCFILSHPTIQAILASRSRVFHKMLYQPPSPQQRNSKKDQPQRETNKLRLFLKRSSEPLLNLQNTAQQVNAILMPTPPASVVVGPRVFTIRIVYIFHRRVLLLLVTWACDRVQCRKKGTQKSIPKHSRFLSAAAAHLSRQENVDFFYIHSCTRNSFMQSSVNFHHFPFSHLWICEKFGKFNSRLRYEE